MEPLNQNWGALPGTVLESGPGPIEVGFKRLGPELELLKQQEKAKIEATKEKAAKAAEAMKLPDYTPVGIPHQGVYANMQNQFMKEQAELERMYQQNPLDSRNDVGNPFSEAGMKRQAGIRRIQDYAAASAEKQKAYYEFLKGAEGKEINPLDMKRMKDWYERSPDITNDGEVVIDPMPVLIGNFDKSTYYTELVKEAKPDIKASSGPSGKGYIFDSATTRLTPEDIKGMAKSAAADYSSNVLFAFLTEEMGNMQQTNPDEYKRIAEEAKKSNMTWQQQKAYEDMLPLAYEQQKKETKADATFNNKMGSGWGKKQAYTERVIKALSGITLGNPEMISETKTLNVPWGSDITTKFSKAFDGVQVSTKQDWKGNEVPVRVKSIAANEGKVYVETVGDDGKKGEVLVYDQPDFINDFVERMAEHDEEIDRDMLYEAANQMGLVQPSGRIEPYQGGGDPLDQEIQKAATPAKKKF